MTFMTNKYQKELEKRLNDFKFKLLYTSPLVLKKLLIFLLLLSIQSFNSSYVGVSSTIFLSIYSILLLSNNYQNDI